VSKKIAKGNIPAQLQPITGAELQRRRRQAEAKFLQIAAALKAEDGITRHDVCKELRGLAWCDSGVILAPEGRTRKQLYILAHECAHVALKHGEQPDRARKPQHVEELEAEQWAHDALRRYGVPVPRVMTHGARRYVGHWIEKDERNGVIVTHEEALRFAGQLTPSRRRALRNKAQPPAPVPSPQSWVAQFLSRIFQRAGSSLRGKTA
jgi:hypothetical protein